MDRNIRRFTVNGLMNCSFSPPTGSEIDTLAGIEVQLWQQAPMQSVFLGKAFTNDLGEYTVEFELESPISNITDGKIKDVFIKAYYNGVLLHQGSDLLTGLVAYWKFDETSGTSATDITGNGHDGTLSGSTLPTWAAGKINNGININGGLSGSDDSYVSVPTSSDFDFGTGDFTYAFWMQPNNNSAYYSPIDTCYPNGGSLLMEFAVPNIVRLYIGGANVYTETIDVTPGDWYYVVLRRIGTDMEMIINNISLGVVTFDESVFGSGTNVYIGKYSGGEALDGILDEFGIWKGRGLTNDEITYLYNGGDGRAYPF